MTEWHLPCCSYMAIGMPAVCIDKSRWILYDSSLCVIIPMQLYKCLLLCKFLILCECNSTKQHARGKKPKRDKDLRSILSDFYTVKKRPFFTINFHWAIDCCYSPSKTNRFLYDQQQVKMWKRKISSNDDSHFSARQFWGSTFSRYFCRFLIKRLSEIYHGQRIEWK